MSWVTVEWLLQALSLVCCLVAIVRLVQLKLFRIYPLFFSYLWVALAQQAVVVRYGICSPQLCWIFVFMEPIRMLGYILVVWELGAVIFRDRGVRVGASALAPAGLILTFAAPDSRMFHGLILDIVRLERGITLSLAILTLTLLLLIWKQIIELAPNSVVLAIVYSVWFLGDSFILLAAGFLSAGQAYVVNDALAAFEIASYIGCSLLLSKAGESPIIRSVDLLPANQF